MLAAAVLMTAGAAHAQSFVRPDCQPLVGVSPNRYDTSEHARWYQRFWTGTCDHLAFCVPGSRPSGWAVIRQVPAGRGKTAEVSS